jgi:fructoselysine-6-P-deglycase FrlB-like protein
MTELKHKIPSGRELLDMEMARQHADALASLELNGDMAARVAKSLARTGRLLLVGMGASHFANRSAEHCYRGLGVEAWACTAAELIQSPLPATAGTVLLVSQSGASGEILQLLQTMHDDGDHFGLTLDAASSLGRALPCLAGSGGAEIAFAATRSLLITIALHARILSALGMSKNEAADVLRSPTRPAIDTASRELSEKTAIVISGRNELRGLAEANALMLMELARMPAHGFEAGQFRHGPLELLSPDIGVILLRGAGAAGEMAAGLARTSLAAGTSPVVFDCSGEASLPGAVTVGLPRLQGLAAVLGMMPALQKLIIDIAASRVERVGEPLRSAKITGVDNAA